MRFRNKVLSGIAVSGISLTILLMIIFDRFLQPAINNPLISEDFSHPCVSDKSKVNIDINQQLTVSVWNIYKQQKDGWNKQLSDLLDNSQLVLLQEASLTPNLKQTIKNHHKTAEIARAFRKLNVVNGVMNITNTPPIKACAELAPEPWIRLAKSALIAFYPISNGQTLLVINLHSINFSWSLHEYQNQLKPLLAAISNHQGPVILAGDFNTWRKARMELIEHLITNLGLKEALPSVDFRTKFMNYPLDHIYYRELNLKSVHIIETNSSDHNPIQVTFSL